MTPTESPILLTAYRGSERILLTVLDLATSQAEVPIVLNESDRIAFELAPREVDTEYEVRIGDFALDRPHHSRERVEWEDDACFDSARGQTIIGVYSRRRDADEAAWTLRGQSAVWIYPRKLTEVAYSRMVADLAEVSGGLLFDLMSKSTAGVGAIGGSQLGRMTVRSAQLHLRVLQQMWRQLSGVLSQILAQPESRLSTRRQWVAYSGREALETRDLAAIAARGIDPRRRDTARPFSVELAVIRQTLDTAEHRVIAAFLDILHKSARQCLERAQSEVAEINKDRWFRDRTGPHKTNLYEEVDAPRISRLELASDVARRLMVEIKLVRRNFPSNASGALLIDGAASPIFRAVRHYRDAWRLMAGYLQNRAVVLDSGEDERTKQTWRMYEQWVFLQLADALRATGFKCVSQRNFFGVLTNNLFTADLHRGTRLDFIAPDGRSVVMRYEPWVYPKHVAVARGETVYQGAHAEAPWSPDVLMEFFRPTPSGALSLEYALVVDAKYVRTLRSEHREQCLKYMQIRSAASDEVIVRQAWLASPHVAGVIPDDDAILWTADGPTSSRNEFLVGAIGLTPGADSDGGDNSGRGSVASEFIVGLIRYLGLETPAS